ncbi:leukocyte elastase inhibitor-like [Ornithodoros turicata]|uniref:leukocyte elastase inhibitor-like n=1 Tax=Ornithodoros turicata TaxID=34597 RepID=UPI003139D930
MSHPEPTQDASEPSSTMQSSDAVHQMNQMGYRCVQFLPNDRNIVVSPYTIANMLVLLHKGSAGDTRAMLEKATNCGNLDRDLSPIFRRLSAELFNDPEGTHDFDLATVVMVGCECVTTPEVSSYLVENLNGRTECVPKENFREKASERLRLWARHATRGEVDRIIDVECGPDEPVVVASALNFRGRHCARSSPRRTLVQPFRNFQGDINPVAMMTTRGVYNYVYLRELRAQAVRVSYDADLSMLFLLPSQPRQILQLEKDVNPQKLNWLLGQMRGMVVDLSLPRFSVEQLTSLKLFFIGLGLGDLFKKIPQGHDFRGLHGCPSLPVGNAFQLVRVLVDENGIGYNLGDCVFHCRNLLGVRRPPVEFHAAHPFLFYVIDSTSEAALIVGRVLRL